MTIATPDELLTRWLEAVATGLPVSAKSYATALLEKIDRTGREPHWNEKRRRFFYAWCDREGLTKHV